MPKKTDMWRTVCSLLCAAAVCVTLISGMAGCSQNARSLQKQLFAKGIVTANNLTVKEISKNHEDSTFLTYFEIDGLKNQAVETKINNRIREVFDFMCSDEYIPPYRGISVRLRQCQSLRQSRSVNLYPTFNCNNLLSVSAYCSVAYPSAEEGYLYAFDYSYEIPLNFDLTTGEEIMLKDLFAADTDYLDLIDRAVDEQLMKSGYDSGTEDFQQELISETMLAAPFRGIKPEQKFYLAEDGYICLLLDYDTPAFYTGFYPLILSLSANDLGDALELFKIPKGQPLYDSDETVYHFMAGTTDKSVDRTFQPKSNFEIYGEYHYQNSMPEAVVNQLDAVTFDEKYRPVDTDEIYEQMAQLYGTSDWHMNVTSLTYGGRIKSTDYFSAERSYLVYAGPEEAWLLDNPVTYEQSYNTRYCFDREGQLLDIAALFTEPEQADALIKQAMTENLVRELEQSDETIPDGVLLEKYARMLIPHINGVNLYTDSLLLSFDLSESQMREMVYECFGDAVNNDYLYILSASTLHYQDIGCQNLIVFDVTENG